MQIKFTEQALSTLSVPEGMRDHQWFDTGLPGFGFRKFASGKAAFFVRYRVGKQQRKITLSKYAPGLLAQIRRKAVDVLAEARLGNDARADTAKRSAGTDLELGEAVRLYLDARQPELDPTWFIEITRFLERYWARFHRRQLQSLERGEMVRELDEIARSRGELCGKVGDGVGKGRRRISGGENRPHIPIRIDTPWKTIKSSPCASRVRSPIR